MPRLLAKEKAEFNSISNSAKLKVDQSLLDKVLVLLNKS